MRKRLISIGIVLSFILAFSLTASACITCISEAPLSPGDFVRPFDPDESEAEIIPDYGMEFPDISYDIEHEVGREIGIIGEIGDDGAWHGDGQVPEGGYIEIDSTTADIGPRGGGFLNGDGISGNNTITLGLWLSIFAVLLAGAALIINLTQARRVRLMQTTRGNVVTAANTLSVNETVSAVKNSEVVPDSRVYSSIIKQINGEK